MGQAERNEEIDKGPDLKEKYKQLAFSRDRRYWTDLREKLKEFQLKKGLNLRIEL